MVEVPEIPQFNYNVRDIVQLFLDDLIKKNILHLFSENEKGFYDDLINQIIDSIFEENRDYLERVKYRIDERLSEMVTRRESELEEK